jgi:hypothetical protein
VLVLSFVRGIPLFDMLQCEVSCLFEFCVIDMLEETKFMRSMHVLQIKLLVYFCSQVLTV